MSDYIERQKVKDIRFSGGIDHDGFLYVPYKELVDGIKALPPADVVPVVRCRKCKYFWTYRGMDSMPTETCELAQTFYNPDIDFCSLAKRIEE